MKVSSQYFKKRSAEELRKNLLLKMQAIVTESNKKFSSYHPKDHQKERLNGRTNSASDHLTKNCFY